MTEEEKPLTKEEVLKLIEEHGGPEGLDLKDRNLEEIDLSFRHDEPLLDLHGIILYRANLKMADLSGADLKGADLARAELQGADLTRADLQGARLRGANMQGADLEDANLQGADLWTASLQEANLFGAKLQGADLSRAKLQGAWLGVAKLQGAKLDSAKLQHSILINANLQNATLSSADLQGADLREANVSGTKLYGAKISHETSLQDVEWGTDHILGDEQESQEEKDKDKKRKQLRQAESVYRNLKQWHAQAGMHDIVSLFYFREMTVRRKALAWWPRPVRWRKRRWWGQFLLRPQLEAYRFLCGYGEKILRVVASGAVVVFSLAGIYSLSALTFLDSLYYSAVSFTAVGYGLWVSNPEGWVKGLGAAEAFMGVFMMALLLITFVRKMTR
jgi:uncharacterized protein YjbI with pentapeptide repeats